MAVVSARPVLKDDILKDILINLLATTSVFPTDDDPQLDCALLKFHLAGKEPSHTIAEFFSEVHQLNITDKYFYVPQVDYFIEPSSPLIKILSPELAKSLYSLNLRSAHPRYLPLLNGIKAPLKILHLNRQVLENEECLAVLSKIAAEKVTIDAEKMNAVDLLKTFPINTRELEITDMSFDNIDDVSIDNPKLLAVEKFGIREYDVKHDQAFHLPAIVATYRKRFPNVKSFDLMFYTIADRDSGILRHFDKKNIKTLKKNNPNIHLRIYIDVEYVKDDPMPLQYLNFLKSKMERVEGFHGAKKFLQVSKKMTVEMFVTFQDIPVHVHHEH